MAGTYTNLNYHIVFSTKERRQLITANIEVELHKYIGGTIRNLDGDLLAANGMPITFTTLRRSHDRSSMQAALHLVVIRR